MTDLESLIDWPLVLSQPRYAGGHEEVMRNIFGSNATVLAEYTTGDYQGQIAFAYLFPNGEVAIMTDYYGSCSGCDAWSDASDEDARRMILGLCGSAKQFESIEAARQWVRGMNPTEDPWDYGFAVAAHLKF